MLSKPERFPLNPDPFIQLEEWLRRAIEARLPHPDAMTLSSVSEDGQPSSRVVLLKGIEKGELRFFTNYGSRKAAELDANPKAALNFFWPALDLQVRVRGKVHRLTRAESEAYFGTRPRGSQIGAWASRQSAEITSRAELEERVRVCEKRFQGAAVPCPEFWGGYGLVPEAFEFWIAHPDRLHDRFLYRRQGSAWKVARLSP